ncbi:callose synthase 3-like isoform X3 [Nicotiana tabacum]|uniref:Callose synthase 3-like isoform X2 n=4 Tax=Nicotiana tabacum TaxID=4097 RepID=A0A1S4CVI6_TOBAC|nr:PREDICTED: callose synthase 3-like isoform X2 [Nicotiana tabacum]
MGLWITGFSCHLKASSAQHHLDHNTLSIHEAARSRRGKAKHSQWRNYDDLNEYFWSADCFRLGWPMRADADFFCLPVEELRAERNGKAESRGCCATWISFCLSSWIKSE